MDKKSPIDNSLQKREAKKLKKVRINMKYYSMLYKTLLKFLRE